MIDVITGFIGGLLYPVFSIIFGILDLLQSIFMAMAGIGANEWFQGTAQGITYGNTGNKYDSGLIFYILNTDMVKNLLMSITLLAVFLLIIFTVMAFIKNAYSTKPKTWQDIIANALKGLISFVFVPVCCLLGVWVSNIVLNAINGATSTGGSVKLSRKLFITCAYNANTYRIDPNLEDDKIVKRVYGFAYPDSKQEKKEDKNSDGTITEDEIEIVVDLPEKPEGYTTAEWYATIIDNCYADETSGVDIYWWREVEHGYSLYQINYLFLVIVGIFMMSVMITLTYAMVRRIFFLAMLFVISPALCAMYPLDDGAMVGKWRTQFVSTTISAYGAVAGMNIFFSLLPLIEHLSLTSISGHNFTLFMDEMFQLFMLVAGLYIVKEFMSTISSLIGGEDAYGKGSQLKSNVNKHLSAKKLIGGGAKFTGAFVKTWKDRKADGKTGFWNGIGSFFAGTGAGLRETVLPKALNESGLGGYWKELRTGWKGGRQRLSDEDREKLTKALAEDMERVQNGGASLGFSGYWKAGASLGDLVKVADKLGIRDEAMKAAGLKPEEYKADQELKKAMEDQTNAVLTLSNTIQRFTHDTITGDSYFTGKSFDEIAAMPKIDTSGLTGDDLEKAQKRNDAIKKAQELREQRAEALTTLEKTTTRATTEFHDEGLRNVAGNILTEVQALKTETNADNFATKTANVLSTVTGKKTDYVDSTTVVTGTKTDNSGSLPTDTLVKAFENIDTKIADAIKDEIARQNNRLLNALDKSSGVEGKKK